ncbi:MAG: NCS1 family nucleobase:cation symporter-1 [Deltaproteobacteria bacterium]|nr:NCS1 family nucleobase:cation symporter-1 [Deltaproteobacteria bacterium]MBW2532148.1 NCS1 family nucleobase:cation symporter-1 [Deltaproteobacteria bacterium]
MADTPESSPPAAAATESDPAPLLEGADPSLINDDIRPAGPAERRWSVLNMAALWVGMVVCVPTYMLAAGLIDQGMSWSQAVLTVLLGNVIVLAPMVLNGHPGTKYGIPFPVMARASFGIRGAHIPSMLRALVACGWFGIQTWVGGSAIYQLLNVLADGALVGAPLPVLGINLAQTGSFLAFWAVQVGIFYKGVESIRVLETWAAPFLLLMGLALLGWAYVKAGGFGEMLSTPSQFGPGGPKEGQFFRVFFPGLTAMVGFWATLSLNIPDFTRYAKSQRDQVLGQALGLPATMTLFAFIGVAVTSATAVIYGETIWDPTILLGRMGGGVSVVIALLALSVATLSTNIAANVVSPANALINLAPKRIDFRVGGYITAGLGIAMFPWKLLETTGGYIFTWLIGYSALLGPIGGILIADYFLLRRTRYDLGALYRRSGPYWYRSGINPVAVVALVIAVLPNLPGFLHAAGALSNVPELWQRVYTYAWFVGFILAGAIYLGGMWLVGKRPRATGDDSG